VNMLIGGRCHVPNINSKNYTLRQYAERQAMNAPIQGGSAEIIKLAMIQIESVLKKSSLKTKVLLQVHDELLCEVPVDSIEAEIPVIKSIMEKVVELSVPLVVNVGIGNNWSETH
jgi:DNA polymerase I